MTHPVFVYWKEPGSREIFTVHDPVVYQANEPVLEKSGFLFFPFETDAPGIILSGKIHPTDNPELAYSFSGSKQVQSTYEAGKAEFESMVTHAVERIRQGSMEKVVLSRRQSMSLPENFNLSSFYQILCSTYPNAMVYAIGTGGDVWIGATPEQLLWREQNAFQTHALAGTRNPGSGNPFGAKEKAEQEFVRGYIETLLKQHGAVNISVSDTEELATGNLIHLINRIRFESNKAGDILKELHPTPAVCGTPRDVSKKYILESEKQPRGFYAGYLGPVYNAESFSLWVNLRCARISGSVITFFAGAGITAGSNPESEWTETENKMNTLRALLKF